MAGTRFVATLGGAGGGRKVRRWYAAQSNEGAWRSLVEPHLGSLPLSEITPLVIERFARERLAEGTDETSVEKAWLLLSSMFKRAEAWGFVAKNPVRLGNSPTMTLDVYAHVYEEWDGRRSDIEEEIRKARSESGSAVRTAG